MAKRGIQGALLRSFGAKEYQATVIGTELLTPRFVRVHFQAPGLLAEFEAAPTSWLRIWFPDPDGSQVEYQRAYTISTACPEDSTFSCDFVLHDPAGPASLWALKAAPGMRLPVTPLGSTRFELPQDLPAGYLLIGDAASLPAINQVVATIPPHLPIELYLEEHDGADRQIPLASHPRLTVRWVHRESAESMARALEARDWSDWFAWVACESAALKHLRTKLRTDFGFPKTETYQLAYWVEGRAMGKQRDPVAVGELLPSSSSANEALRAASSAGEAAAPATSSAAEPTSTPGAAEISTAVAGTTVAEPATAAARGTWKAQAGRRLLAPLRRVFLAAGIAQGLVTLLQLAPYILLTELARLLLEGRGAPSAWALALWAGGLLAAGALLEIGLIAWLHRVDATFTANVRSRLLAKLARLPLGWFQQRTSGQVKRLVDDDTLALHYLLTHAVPDAVAAALGPAVVLLYLLAVDWRLGLALFGPILVYAFHMWVMLVRSGTKTAESVKWAERMEGHAGQYLDGQGVTRIFGGSANFRRQLDAYITFLGDWQRPFTKPKTVMDLATRPQTFLLLIAFLGTALISTSALSPAALLPFLLLGTTFGTRLTGIGYGLMGLRTGLLAAQRIQVTLDEKELTQPELPELELPAGSPVAEGARVVLDGNELTSPTRSGMNEPCAVKDAATVTFDGVHFGYHPGISTLTDINLTLTPGSVTALVGPSGAGKSTLAGLLARFHDVTGGAVLINGRDIRELTGQELYATVGFVFQRPQLVRATAAENIALARPEATHSEVVRAARAAHIHERLTALPSGYDTPLGGGLSGGLSGGEKQRVAIARVLLQGPPVLVLDEATAFADPESEYEVQRALSALAGNRTVLVIAHRLRAVQNADRIVVLDGGRVAEQGTHEQLLECAGIYRRLWDTQEAAR